MLNSGSTALLSEATHATLSLFSACARFSLELLLIDIEQSVGNGACIIASIIKI